jgi:hypothetical protein
MSIPKKPETQVNTHTLMHKNEVVAIAKRSLNTFDVLLPGKLPFGLRNTECDYIAFDEWLRKRVDNLQRTYMNKVYMARKIGRCRENILRDSCALSVTDHFWIRRSDVDLSWAQICEIRDQNMVLADVALTGEITSLDWEAAREGKTSMFTVKGAFAKAILGGTMLKAAGTQEYEWVACVIGNALGLPVQRVTIKNPSPGGRRENDGTLKGDSLDDTVVAIDLFTSSSLSLVHAKELYPGEDFSVAEFNGQHHRYFYERLPSDEMKRDFERILILSWLISNHDMHSENFGCLYDCDTFGLVRVAPAFDHNSASFDGSIPELDIPDIIAESIHHHGDVIHAIKEGKLDEALSVVGNWLNENQKNCVKEVANKLVQML